jgi:hypothetical protein
MIAIITLFNYLEVDCCFDAIVCWLVISADCCVKFCMDLIIVFDPKNHIITSTIDCCVDSKAVFEG